jgi:hypothetical protein
MAIIRYCAGWVVNFANRSCPHHESFREDFSRGHHSRRLRRSTPRGRGCREFTVNDEPYTKQLLSQGRQQAAANVTVLATSMLPPNTPKPETVSWCVERADSGRGFAIVMPHFYRNWKLEELRRYILNGIVWTAKLDVPAEGVQTTLPDLSTFSPVAVEPQPRAPKPGPAAPK